MFVFSGFEGSFPPAAVGIVEFRVRVYALDPNSPAQAC